MPAFLIGLLLGAVSGGGTYWLTADGQLAAIVGAVVTVLAWLGVAALVIVDD